MKVGEEFLPICEQNNEKKVVVCDERRVLSDKESEEIAGRVE